MSSSDPSLASASRSDLHRGSRGFDITGEVRRVCQSVVVQVPELSHVDLDRVGFSVSQTRRATMYGIFASLTPLRFEGGATVKRRRGRDVTVQRVIDRAGRELLYIFTLYLPRFMDLTFDEKLTTIFHELWHVAPEFNGDVRRHEGRCYAHTSSQAQFDDRMRALSQQWLDLGQEEPLIGFLRLNFGQIAARHGSVFGTRYARPRIVPVGRV